MRKLFVPAVIALVTAASTSVYSQNKSNKTAVKSASKTTTETVSAKGVKGVAHDATIMTLGPVKVPVSEFSYVYRKNNVPPRADLASDERFKDAYTDKSVREYLDLYINFKLKVMDAEKAGLDTVQSFRKELDTYRKQLAQPYLTEKAVTDKLVKEAYDRLGTEINASHILITVTRDANPKDTLAAYNKILDIKRKITAGESFESLAAALSQDPSAKQNSGNLGYFSALQMVYPFEDAAYKTPKGAVSGIIRTDFGYHILKVIDKRPSQGTVKAAHIMVKLTAEMSPKDSLAAKEKIKEIYAKLQKGEKWDALCQQFSDDEGTKNKNGELQPYTTGNLIPSFEEQVSKLKKPEDYTAPFMTPYGWHIAKLISRKGLEPFSEAEAGLKQKVNKDSRSALNSTALIARLKREDQFAEIPAAKKLAFSKADTSLLSARFTYSGFDKTNDKTLFTIKKQPYTIASFFDFVKETQQARKGGSPQFLMELAYKAYVEKELLKYEEDHLSDKYEDYRMLLKEYRDGILLFGQMETKVWNKAIEDTSGLKVYFKANNKNYNWQTRAKARIINANNQSTLDEVQKKLTEKRFALSEPKIDDIMFEKNSDKISDKGRIVISTIASYLATDKSFSVDIVGHFDGAEKSSLGKKRSKAVFDSLMKRNIDASRLVTRDMGKTMPSKSGRVADNQRVEIIMNGSTAKQLERTINNNAPLKVSITEGLFQKDDNPNLANVPFKVGTTRIEKDGRIMLIEIFSIEQPREKYLDEAKGMAIVDYQNYLEKQWIDGLKKEYPVTVSDIEVQKLVKK